MPTREPVIRRATSADLAAVAGIYAHYVRDTVATFDEIPPSVADWQHKLGELTALGLPFLVAETGDTVLGFAYAAPWRPKPAYRHTVEDTIYLAPEGTGRGLGRALLGSLLQGCADAGVHQVVAVIADSGNGASTGLHRALGFRDVGTLSGVGRKHGRWIDTTLMQLDLGPR